MRRHQGLHVRELPGIETVRNKKSRILVVTTSAQFRTSESEFVVFNLQLLGRNQASVRSCGTPKFSSSLAVLYIDTWDFSALGFVRIIQVPCHRVVDLGWKVHQLRLMKRKTVELCVRTLQFRSLFSDSIAVIMQFCCW